MSALVTIDERKVSATGSLWWLVSKALHDGKRVHLQPPARGGFILVQNGPAILATDLSGEPVGTYSDAGAAIDAWRTMRGGGQ